MEMRAMFMLLFLCEVDNLKSDSIPPKMAGLSTLNCCCFINSAWFIEAHQPPESLAFWQPCHIEFAFCSQMNLLTSLNTCSW